MPGNGHGLLVNGCDLLCDLLGNGVLHLQAGVDLDEVVPSMFIHQELHCASVLIAHLYTQTDPIRYIPLLGYFKPTIGYLKLT